MRFLKRGDFDVLIGPTDLFRGQDQLLLQDVGSLVAFPFVRKGHPLSNTDTVTLDALRQYPMIVPELFVSYAGTVEQLYSSSGSDARAMVSVIDYFPLITSIVRSSNRIGVVGAGYHQSSRFSGDFDVLDIDCFAPLAFSAATLGDGMPKPAIRALISLLPKTWRGTASLFPV